MVQNIIGENPEFNGTTTIHGDAVIDGNIVVAGKSIIASSSRTALQLSYQSIESAVYAGTSTFLAGDIFGGNVVIKSGVGDVFTLCSADDIEAVLSSAFGTAIAINETFWVTFINIDVHNDCTITSSSDFVTVNGDFILPSKGHLNIKFKKYSDTPLGYLLIA